MANREWCKHYNGLAINTHCEAGVEMYSVADQSTRPFGIPCIDPKHKQLCPRHEHYTDQEVAESEASILVFINGLNAFSSGASRTCPTCGAAIEAIDLYEKTEPDTYSLYTRPCNHRHGLWGSAPAWAVSAGIVTVIPFPDEADAAADSGSA